MRKAVILFVAAIFLTGCLGCAASKLSMTGADGSTLTLENYVVTEIYGGDGKVAKRTMIPAKSIIEGAMEKIIKAVKSVLDMTDAPVDVAKTAVPALLK